MLISISRIAELRLRTDNPGGGWLKEEQTYNTKQGLNRHNAPVRFGAITGTWTRHVLLPVSVLAKIKGSSGEQSNVRQKDLDSLTQYMQQNKKLPSSDPGGTDHYVPFIMVYQDGTPYVSEGNHRIMAAAKLGYKFLPIALQYNSGAELADGPLSPARVKQFDATALAHGYSLTDYAK